jgi:hypothetical protein
LLLGGSLTIKRGMNQRGTCIEAFIPLGEPDDKQKKGQPRLPPSAPSLTVSQNQFNLKTTRATL